LFLAMAVLTDRARRPAALGALAAAALAAVLIAPPATAAAGNKGGKPNIVVITTDDQPLSMVNARYMPQTMKLLAGKGTTFTDFIATTPLCCPSRAALITGQYGHNNGVLENNYSKLKDKANTLPVWLQEAGYRTIHIGKYLNGYENFTDPPTEPAPGWDRWFTQVAPRRYNDYELSLNGRSRAFGDRDRDYLTEVLNRKAEKWAKRFAKGRRPLYLQLDQYAPHKSGGGPPCRKAAVPAPRDEDRFDDEPLPKPPSFDEQDVTDKPAFIQPLSPIDAGAEQKITKRFRCAVESLRAVDRGVKKIRRALKRANEWSETVVLFTSDNGFFYGEHRIEQGKELPYEENLHLPLIARVPKPLRGGLPRVPTVDQPVANIDIAPTILALTGASSCAGSDCRVMDGRSLLDLIKGDTSAWPADRSLVVEQRSCNYRGLRAEGHILIEHQAVPDPVTGDCIATDDAELYDLSTDPFQLVNLFGAGRQTPDGLLQQQLEARLLELRDCAGIQGRDPVPAAGVFCE
jgi:arylsulfatase A-like enzyme